MQINNLEPKFRSHVVFNVSKKNAWTGTASTIDCHLFPRLKSILENVLSSSRAVIWLNVPNIIILIIIIIIIIVDLFKLKYKILTKV